MAQHQLVINNKKVYEFYTKNKHIQFEHMSCLMVDILEKISKNMDPSIDISFAEKVLGSINTLQSQIDKIFESKFEIFKKEYTQELNVILQDVNNTKITSMLSNYNEMMHDRTKLLFSEIFPKNNETITNQITGSFGLFDRMITSTEARIQQTLSEKLNSIPEISATQNKISESVNSLVNKFHNSSHKGNFSEKSIVDGLTVLYPYGNIEHIGNKISNSGDIFLHRKDRTKIIIENKEYDKTVVQHEVDKFINNVLLNKCDGIMLSQSSQIIFKDDYEINFNGDSILVYICNVNYDISKIRTAISIIDHLKDQKEIIKKDQVSIKLSTDEIDIINKEYHILLNQKKILIKTITESYNKNMEEIKKINIPALEFILTRQFGVKLSDEESCPWCGKICKNNAGVSAHLKSCKEVPKDN
jgi:hypothetical protein